jgi:alcohol dehydrogenase
MELDLAPPGPGEALVRLRASGLCHSDLNAIDGTAETPCPAVLGHEGAGVVDAAGPGVSLAPGTHVVLSWLPACGDCEECRRGLQHLCASAWAAMATGGLLDGTPRLSRDGEPIFHYCFVSSFAERAVVPARSCVPVPADVPFEVAALVGCAVTTGTGAVWRTAGVRPGERVSVIGCGGVGMSAVMGAVAVGAAPIVAVDLDEDRLELARSFGATDAVRWTGGADETAERVRAASGGGVDYAIEATGRAEAARAAFLSTRPRGAAVLIGIPHADAVLSRARFDVRLRPPRARLSSPARPLPPRAPAARPADLGPPASRGDRGGLRGAPLGPWPARGPRPRRSERVTDPLDGRIGEAWSGEVPNGSHINLVLARRGSPTAAAAAAVLASPRPGHLPILACLKGAGTPVRPATIVVNKVTIDGDGLARMTWGAAQLGIAQGVLDAVAEGLLDAVEAADVIVVVAVWVDPDAHDETAVRTANREATRAAVADALEPPAPEAVRALAEQRDEATNAYYAGD